MLRGAALAASVLACACAPSPAAMTASEASEHLERFASGAPRVDVCTPGGRAVLRGAVRAYGAELARAGVEWPTLSSDSGLLRSADVAVAVAFAAGFIESSDFQAQARRDVSRFALLQWPHLRDMRAAARVACAQVLELQAAASHLATETTRYRRMLARAEQSSADAERLRLQRARLSYAEAQLEALANVIQREIEAARASRTRG